MRESPSLKVFKKLADEALATCGTWTKFSGGRRPWQPFPTQMFLGSYERAVTNGRKVNNRSDLQNHS